MALITYRDAIKGLLPFTNKSHTKKELFEDGWLAYSKKPPGSRKELKNYIRIYERCQVTQNMIDNLLKYVSDWTKSNIKVYAFLVPSCREMYELEEKSSGFNQNEFVKAFKDSGGIWIDIDPAAYDTFDGSHLQRTSAVELSKLLASKIQEIERY